MSRPTGPLLNASISGHDPVVVLIHGYLASLHYWDGLRELLEKNYTVVAMDLLGFGDSPKPRGSDYGYDEQIALIKRTLGHHKVGKPSLIIGHSMGALLALRYVSVTDKATDRLLLLNMPVFSNAGQARHELARTNPLYRMGLYWGLHRVIWPIIRTQPARTALRRMLPPDWVGAETMAFSSTARSRSRSLRNVIEAYSCSDDLKRLSVPTTLIVGLKDRRIYQRNLRQIAVSPRLRVLMTDTGHNTLGEKLNFVVSLI